MFLSLRAFAFSDATSFLRPPDYSILVHVRRVVGSIFVVSSWSCGGESDENMSTMNDVCVLHCFYFYPSCAMAWVTLMLVLSSINFLGGCVSFLAILFLLLHSSDLKLRVCI